MRAIVNETFFIGFSILIQYRLQDREVKRVF